MKKAFVSCKKIGRRRETDDTIPSWQQGPKKNPKNPSSLPKTSGKEKKPDFSSVVPDFPYYTQALGNAVHKACTRRPDFRLHHFSCNLLPLSLFPPCQFTHANRSADIPRYWKIDSIPLEAMSDGRTDNHRQRFNLR